MRGVLLILPAMRPGESEPKSGPRWLLYILWAFCWSWDASLYVSCEENEDIDLATEYSCEQKSFPSCSLRSVEMYSTVMKVSKYTFSWIWTGLKNSANINLRFSSHVTKSLLCLNQDFYRSWPSKEVQLMSTLFSNLECLLFILHISKIKFLCLKVFNIWVWDRYMTFDWLTKLVWLVSV